jgi:glycosyltransferase involved in cell wall biosynthesis
METVSQTDEGSAPRTGERLVFIGSRGVPAMHGGFERFVEEVAKGLHSLGWDVTVVLCAEHPSDLARGCDARWQGIRLMRSRYSKSKSPFLFYRDSLGLAEREGGLIYVCGVGVAPWLWLRRPRGDDGLFINLDGLEWRRTKWSRLGRALVRALYALVFLKRGATLICDSPALVPHFTRGFLGRRVKTVTVAYGADPNRFANGEARFEEHLPSGLSADGYYLVVARLEPENGVLEIVRAHGARPRRRPLVVVGPLREDAYCDALRAASGENVVFLGGVYDSQRLEALRAGSRAYFHGHSVGGTNPSLLESMAARSLVCCADNEFNRATAGRHGLYYSDIAGCARLLDALEDDALLSAADREERRVGVFERWYGTYRWPVIVREYDALFHAASRVA